MFQHYILIILASALLAWLLPKMCFRIARGHRALTQDDKSLLKFLSIFFFISFSISFYLLYFSIQTRDTEIALCKKSQGVYVYQKHSNNLCIEQNAYDEYQKIVQQAYEKYRKSEIKLN